VRLVGCSVGQGIALENARGTAANPSTFAAVQATLEAEGIEFLNGAPGVPLRHKGRSQNW
jgi:hypothetical protein